MKNFSCPNCKSPISIKEIFRFRKNHQTNCNNCKTILKPKNIKSWNWGFGIGLLSVVIPATIILHFYDNFLIAAIISICSAVIAISLVALYTYLSVEFEKE
ncbi:MAG: hypothetical protein IPM32_08610 [Ignavibacteriae bacterium]|nr:hypothetical protein [Ignavibacteriota bacterium]